MKLAIVTGTSSGIGEAVALELLRKRWRVVGMARRPAAIEAAEYTHVAVDLANAQDLIDRLEPVAGPLVEDPSAGRIGLVNNAADGGLLGPVDRIDPAEMLRAFAVNVVAPSVLMGWIVRRAAASAALRIVNVSSGAAVAAFPGLGAYCGTKAALRMIGMVLASELDARERAGDTRDASILSYEPGTVDTPMQVRARTSSPEIFPSVEMFKQLAANGMLIPPAAPAGEIAAYLGADNHARFTERRYGR